MTYKSQQPGLAIKTRIHKGVKRTPHVGTTTARSALRLALLAFLTATATPGMCWAQPVKASSDDDPALEEPQGNPTTQPSENETAAKQNNSDEEASPPRDQQEAHNWLTKIEARSRTILTIHAKARYDRLQGLVGDRQRRFGTLVYDAGPPSRFSVHFDYLLVDRRLDPQDRRYIFDGQWLVERYEQNKLFIKRQIVPPPQPGHENDASSDLLALGQGPFPLPVTMDKNRILERFVVSTTDPTQADPPNSIHLHLVPRDSHPSRFTELDLWYDRQTLLPMRARTLDDSENESIVELTEIQIDNAVLPQLLDTSAPTEPGWRVEIKPWQDQ